MSSPVSSLRPASVARRARSLQRSALRHPSGKGSPRSDALSALMQTSDSRIMLSAAMVQTKVSLLRHVKASSRSPEYLQHTDNNRANTRAGVSTPGRVCTCVRVQPPAIELRGNRQRQLFPDTKSSGVSESVHVHDQLRGTEAQVDLPCLREGHSPFRRMICPHANLRLVDNAIYRDGPVESEFAAPRQSSTAGAGVPSTQKQKPSCKSVCMCAFVC